jgi:hypothetical protein
MKKGLIIILTLITGFGLGWWFNEMNRFTEGVIMDAQKLKLQFTDAVILSNNSDVVQEDFDDFFYKFMLEPDFQVSRVKFPLKFIGFKNGHPGNHIDTVYLLKDKWKHKSYYLGRQYIPIIYDNYDLVLQNTDERLFRWAGVENGIDVKSFFKRIGGQWYLIQEENFST